jgi:microcystin-dependent protein
MSEKINDTTETGSSQAHENRPPYYALAFIMRVE